MSATANPLALLLAAKDHFAIFGVPQTFALDKAAFEARYRELTRLTHPDNAGSEAEEQMAAVELSTKVNEAYRVLADPEARANYLLGLVGGPSPEDKSLPDGFLTHILAMREELEEAQDARDLGRLRDFRAQAESGKQTRLAKVNDLFAMSPDPATLKQIRVELNVLRYMQRMLEQIDPKKSATGEGL